MIHPTKLKFSLKKIEILFWNYVLEIFQILDERGECRVEVFENELGLQQSNASFLLSELVKCGYVKRKKEVVDHDWRIVHFCLNYDEIERVGDICKELIEWKYKVQARA